MKVHNVTVGPYEDPEVDGLWWLVCLCEEEGEVHETEFSFGDLDQAYRFKNHFKISIDPIDLIEEEEHIV